MERDQLRRDLATWGGDDGATVVAGAGGPVTDATGARLPTFLVIGAMKAGTTSLWHYLRAHPQVFMPDVKELQFFSDPASFATNLDWYRAQFAGAGPAVAIGEASTNYTKHPNRGIGSPERIASLIPDVRLVYVVRDPIERIRSHYIHVVWGHGERRPLSVVVRENPELVDISRYRMQIDRYLAHFDRSQLLVVTAESLLTDRAATLGRVHDFLGVDRSPVADPQVSVELHRSEEKRLDTVISTGIRRIPGFDVVRRLVPRRARLTLGLATKRAIPSQVDATMADALRCELVETLRPEVRGLRELLHPSFDGWGIA